MLDHSDLPSDMHKDIACLRELLEINFATDDPVIDCDTAVIDPPLVPVIQKLRAAYDFAYPPRSPGARPFGTEDLDRVSEVVRALPSLQIEGQSLPRTHVRQIMWAAEARASILHLECFGAGTPWIHRRKERLTPSMIAALGRVSLRQVQSAVRRRDLRASWDRNESYYDPREAYEWLIKQRGFVPWPTPDKKRRQLHRDLLRVRTKAEFCRLVDRIARDIDDDDDSHWDTPGALASVRSGRYLTDDVLALRQVAAHLRAPDRAAFVGTAITLALRHVGE
jgi:hypothetical protein